MIEDPPSAPESNDSPQPNSVKKSAADRARRYRERKKNDILTVSVTVFGASRDRLVRKGWMTQSEADDKEACAAALSDFLECAIDGRLNMGLCSSVGASTILPPTVTRDNAD